MKNLLLLSVGLLSVWTAFAKATYCVIDLSGGPSAAKYPVTYLESEPSGGFNTDEYKTTKLVLKRVEAGSFIMGEDQTDESHRVILTKPFYMGIFEVTQKQWELVMDSNPSYFTGDTRPVEQVSYNMVRGASEGAKWPESNAVDEGSFLGNLRVRTGIDFDLPMEAQWEFACRAGTTTVYSYGDEVNGDYMWYGDNSDSQSHTVGARMPNPWGFYDLHGNVWEWCLDWRGDLSYGLDPVGASSDASRASRITRGGSWCYSALRCRSAHRDFDGPSRAFNLVGLRIVISLTYVKPLVENDDGFTVAGDAESGFVVKPSAANRNVYLEIPDGVDAAKVTVEVSPDVRTVTPNGAAVRVVRDGADITDYLDIPAAVGGVIVLGAATVKAEYANEPLDVSKGAVIDLSSAESPSLTTAPTRSGLVYQLKEGETLLEMVSDADGDQTIGDGAAWKPNLTVKGGESGFYTIKVEK